MKGAALALCLLLPVATFGLDLASINASIAETQSKYDFQSSMSWGGVGIEVVGLGLLLADLGINGKMTALTGAAVVATGGGLFLTLHYSGAQIALGRDLKRYTYVRDNFGRLPADDADDIWAGTLRIGATKNTALAIMGPPTDINTTQFKGTVQEQWVYSLSTYLYFEDGLLTAMQY